MCVGLVVNHKMPLKVCIFLFLGKNYKTFCIGKGHEYMPLHDLKFMLEASKLREQVENHQRACT
jgi:hypothetical protein